VFIVMLGNQCGKRRYFAKLSRFLNGFQSGFTFTNPSYLAPHRQEVIVKRYLNSLSSSQVETPAHPETVLRPIDNDAWKPLHTGHLD